MRRGRRLVVSFIMTAVNYEYCFYWYLYQVGAGRRIRKQAGRQGGWRGTAGVSGCGLGVLTSNRVYATAQGAVHMCESCRVVTQQPWLVRMAH